MKKIPLIALALSFAAPASAQLGPDANDQLRRVAEKVAEEMQTIDKLLTARDPAAAREASTRAASGIQKMLDQAQTTNKRVQQGIDELIEQLKNCGL